jgi:hypothetical protein
MKQNISYRQTFISDCSEKNPEFMALFDIFKSTLKPGMIFREFKAYYCSAKLDYIDVTFILLNNIVIGFCSAAFYTTNINNKTYTIGRAATGVLELYRGHTLPKWKLYKKYIHYWCKHPFRHFILSAYVANPLIYAMICKYTGVAYPKPVGTPPENIIRVKNELLRSQNLHAKEDPAFVVEIHFCVSISDKEQERIFKSRDGAVKYFLKINPKFTHQHGVVVIIPVNLKNIAWSSYKFLYYKYLKMISKLVATFRKPANPLGGEINFT